MRKTLFFALILVLSRSAAAKGRVKILTIMNTNDTHSCIEPFNPNASDTAMANKGGFLRRDAMLRNARKTDKNLLLFDSGDFSQGSPYYNVYHGDVEIQMMNKMKYDAVTIGNHEFDFGLDNTARIFKMAKFPIVCANYGFKGTVLEGIVKPYVVIKRKGLKIGVFGIGPKMDGLVQKKSYVGVTYETPYVAANRTAALLRDSLHCDLVICLSHLGWNTPPEGDNETFTQTRNVDLVLGGHSHTLFTAPRYLKDADGKSLPDFQVGSKGFQVGCLKLTMEEK